MIKKTAIRLTGRSAERLDVQQATKNGKALAKKLSKTARSMKKLDNVDGIDFDSKKGVVKAQVGDSVLRTVFDENGKVQKLTGTDTVHRSSPEKVSIHANANGTVTYIEESLHPKFTQKFCEGVVEKAVLDKSGEVIAYHLEKYQTHEWAPDSYFKSPLQIRYERENPPEPLGYWGD